MKHIVWFVGDMMKASETKFQPIIEGTKQYVVPLFQRPYSWKKEQWEILWSDLVELCLEDAPVSHFIGSIVTIPTTSVPEGVTKYLLIDGQQRLTTLIVLLTLLRDLTQESEPELSSEIEQTMLVNPFKRGDDNLKLLPTQLDRVAFKSLIYREQPNGSSQLHECYEYFRRKIASEACTPWQLKQVISTRLSVVSIVLDRDDNPHLVFESLNAKGRPLTQSDLIRNYFFMRIHTDQHTAIYHQHWEPMQMSLGDDLTEFIRHYLMRDGSPVKQGDVYFTLKNRVADGDAIPHLIELSRFAGYYKKFIDPQSEAEPALRNALKRLKRVEVTTAYPFLLKCYDDYHAGRISAGELLAVLQLLENYMIRRFVCSVPTNQLNKIFPALYSEAEKLASANGTLLVDGVRLALQTRGYPKDAEFRSNLVTTRLYGGGDRAIKTKLILETIESGFGHKERALFDDLTIEHVMPQSLTEWWQGHLGEDWETDHELCLHTLGNLTLTAYNAELSNETFPRKNTRFSNSHLELNRYFPALSSWTRREIETRSEALADVALWLWPYFGETQPTDFASLDTVTGKKPVRVIIMGQSFAVETWRDVQAYTLETIADVEPEKFMTLVEQYPRLISSDANRFRRKRQLRNGYFIEVNLSARDIYVFCAQAIQSIGLPSTDWVVETMQKEF